MTPLVSPYIKSGMVFGTETERRLLDALGSPDDRLKIVHIAGTNGKGSTAIFLSSILKEAGKSVGTFMTPFVYRYEDMFQINCTPADEDTLTAVMQEVLSCMESNGIYATQFEVETATAILLFKEQGCKYAVLECGMGGKDDATNAVHKKRLALITDISYEHTEYLGKTLPEITAAKAGIIKDCPWILEYSQFEEVYEYFGLDPWDMDMNCPVKYYDIKDAVGLDGVRFKCGNTWYLIHAHGEEQAYNALLAMQAARELCIGLDVIKAGLEKACIPGRIDEFHLGRKLYVLDGAHNPSSFYTLEKYLRDTRGSLRIIYGCLRDKNATDCLDYLSGFKKAKVSVVSPPSPRAMDEDRIYEICSRYFKDVTRYKTVTEALDASTETTTVVCGSFTFLPEALKWLDRKWTEKKSSKQ
ncbi:MAG: hypothetical protein LUD51_07480 [Clostridia bacterium]|nr:hypothetical protein [Clostridia bacterium]